ncbi:MAG: O-antigen ligase family protein [bacterium]|nr:O-antigen ligase family protein [bacterium]
MQRLKDSAERWTAVESHQPARRGTTITIMAVAVVSLVASRFLVSKLGVELYAFTLVGVLAAALFATASFRNLMVPFVVWVVAVGGFRFLWSVRSPVLPDLYLDRMMMIWLGVIFMIKYVAERRALRGPFVLDLLLLAHGLYIYIRVYIQDSQFVQPWFMSVAIPYIAYFFAKNVVVGERNIRALWWSLFALVVYYSFTAIVEKYRIDSLVFPRSILAAKELEFRGRSIGPFEHPGVFGTAFATLIPLHLYLIATARSQFVRIVVGLCLLAALAGLYFTYTRGSWLAGVVGLAVAVQLNWRRFVPIVAPAAIAAAILAVAVLGLRNDEFMKERVENDDTLGSRVGTAVTVLRVWRDHPLFGVGFFQFRAVREDYVQPVEAPLLGTIRFSQFRHNPIHDIYLGPLAEDGLIGALMQFGIYFLILKKAYAVYRSRGPDDHFGQLVLPVCVGAFAAYLVGGLAFDYRYFSFNGALFYMIAGMLAGYQRTETSHVSS